MTVYGYAQAPRETTAFDEFSIYPCIPRERAASISGCCGAWRGFGQPSLPKLAMARPADVSDRMRDEAKDRVPVRGVGWSGRPNARSPIAL